MAKLQKLSSESLSATNSLRELMTAKFGFVYECPDPEKSVSRLCYCGFVDDNYAPHGLGLKLTPTDQNDPPQNFNYEFVKSTAGTSGGGITFEEREILIKTLEYYKFPFKFTS